MRCEVGGVSSEGLRCQVEVRGLSKPMYPQAELRPGNWLAGWLVGGITTRGRLPTSRTKTRELTWLAGWLAVGGITTREPVMRLAGWLAGWGAGWLAEAQRGSERPREAQRPREAERG